MTLRFLFLLALAANLALAAEHPESAPPASAPAATSSDAPPLQNAAGHESPAQPEAAPETHPAAAATPEAAKEHDAAEKFSIHPPAPEQPATPEEIASLLRIGQTKIEQADYVSSELAFRQVLAERASPEQDCAALMGLARTYRKKAEYTKAAAVYETLVKRFPESAQLPVVYLELGRTLRALGAYKPALTRFYSVINSTLKLPDDNPDFYRQLARTAQFEIAETYFQVGDYEQANRFFSRLKLLDLAPEDRARAHFKSVYALTLAGDHEKAALGFKAFLNANPDDENVPEARYLLAVSLRKLGRYNESLAAALDLLRAEKSRVDADPRRWAYWQRKTGNQLANQFYEHGDFGSALLIYQGLAHLSSELAWRLPVTYQIGLCNERLRMADRAREAYQTIVDNVKASETDGTRRPELAELADMAAWRLKHLAWEQTTDRQLTALFPLDYSQNSPLTRPAAITDHDASGSAAASPVTLR